MERHLILVIDEQTGHVLASRAVAESLVDNLIANLDVSVDRITSGDELKKSLTRFGFHLTSQTVAYRIAGL